MVWPLTGDPHLPGAGAQHPVPHSPPVTTASQHPTRVVALGNFPKWIQQRVGRGTRQISSPTCPEVFPGPFSRVYTWSPGPLCLKDLLFLLPTSLSLASVYLLQGPARKYKWYDFSDSAYMLKAPLFPFKRDIVQCRNKR